MPTYATIDDFIVYTGIPIPAPMPADPAMLITDGCCGSGTNEVPPRIFIRASMAVDKALVGAIYDTDSTGMPTDTTLVEVFKDATCAQARPLVDAFLSAQSPWGKDAKLDTYYVERLQQEGALTVEAFDILRSAGLLPITLRMLG
jgi:hypothetical protein